MGNQPEEKNEMVDYELFVSEVAKLKFVPDTKSADAMVKAVCGILASRLNEPQARNLTDGLPEPLTYDRLRSHQVRPIEISFNEYIEEISAQFNLDTDQSVQVIMTVLHQVKENLDEKVIEDLEENMPRDWSQTFKLA